MPIKPRLPLVRSFFLTIAWLVACYLILFALFGLSTGPLGTTIASWFDCCLADAGTKLYYGASDNRNLRMFCAAMVALYGCVPLATTLCVFLPLNRGRKFVITDEGLYFPDGFDSLRGITFWNDINEVRLQRRFNQTIIVLKVRAALPIKIDTAQISKPHLEQLLSTIDERANDCIVSGDVIAMRNETRMQVGLPSGTVEQSLSTETSYMSTIFVPSQPGQELPNGLGRVVSVMASRPLSCVYLVRRSNGELCVAKQFFVANEDDETEKWRKAFEREYELLSALDHTALSKVIEVSRDGQSTFLLLSHIEGNDLRSLVNKHGAPQQTIVIEWAIQICRLMEYLHSHNPPIVHRDLTPDNLVLSNNGSVTVIDFGAAHQFLEGITGTIIGKQNFIAPEQLRGHASRRSDIYSFGCSLYFLLTGEEPVGLQQCDLGGTSYVASALSELVGQCTNFEESNRPQSFSEVRERLEEIQLSLAPAVKLSTKRTEVLAQ